jgi:hypothetical protein
MQRIEADTVVLVPFTVTGTRSAARTPSNFVKAARFVGLSTWMMCGVILFLELAAKGGEKSDLAAREAGQPALQNIRCV